MSWEARFGKPSNKNSDTFFVQTSDETAGTGWFFYLRWVIAEHTQKSSLVQSLSKAAVHLTYWVNIRGETHHLCRVNVYTAWGLVSLSKLPVLFDWARCIRGSQVSHKIGVQGKAAGLRGPMKEKDWHMNTLFLLAQRPRFKTAWVSVWASMTMCDNSTPGSTDRQVTCVQYRHSAQLLPILFANPAL